MTSPDSSSSYHVILPDGSIHPLAEPYGHEIRYEEEVFQVALILSPVNLRVQVLNYRVEEPETGIPLLAQFLIGLAEKNKFGKIWVKARTAHRANFESAGFRFEGECAAFFADGTNSSFMAYYPLVERLQRPVASLEDRNILIAQKDTLAEAIAQGKAEMKDREVYPLPKGYSSRLFVPEDAPKLAALYDEIFPTYPYPINTPRYLVETAATHILYRLIFNQNGELVAAASAETDGENRNAEMTDFATLPSQRGYGLGQYLLQELEKDAASVYGIRTFYTIARIASVGVMRIFFKLGYQYKGTLTNNCTISGQFETMVLLQKLE
ncbi:MAG: putative beta-lysine N-acetyltransferase [Candidatus Sumerlaeia bacterium]|nr:putative beta-lysine N-acetyltransferase [Candidatus Sumerlaeia bacterium]